MRRGQVWWADLPPPIGRRPVVLLSRNEAYAVRHLIIVAPVITRIRGIPSEVPLGPRDGLPRPCAANLDTIYTISKAAVQSHITDLLPDRLSEMDAAIRFALGLPA